MFARGRAGRGVRQLSLDLRRVMEPLTATRLQVCTPTNPPLPALPGSRLRGCGVGSNYAGPHSTWLEKTPLGALRGSGEGARKNAFSLGLGRVPETGD